MLSNDPKIRDFLVAALRGEAVPWPAEWNGPAAIDGVHQAAVFHGVAGLLVDQPAALSAWPARLTKALHGQARAQAMWELRHRQLMTQLLAEFEQRGIPSLMLKGTAIAYDLYGNPANRSRGDTDLLVAADAVPQAEAALEQLGYAAGALGGVSPEFALQQSWTLRRPDGGSHSVDLHWQVMNAPSLKRMFSFAECVAHSRALPRLSPLARAMDRVRLLIHTCLHRALQANSPYFVDGSTYREPDRLIWLSDIHLIARSLSEDDWSALCELAGAMGVSRQCLEGLRAVQASLKTEIPASVLKKLDERGREDSVSPYFIKSHALTRGWHDMRSFSGASTRLRYVLSRITATEGFLRAKYPHLDGRALPLLYGRRLIDLVWRRPDAS